MNLISNSKLVQLDVGNNNLSSLDISASEVFYELLINNNPIISFDIDNLDYLDVLNVTSTNISCTEVDSYSSMYPEAEIISDC